MKRHKKIKKKCKAFAGVPSAKALNPVNVIIGVLLTID